MTGGPQDQSVRDAATHDLDVTLFVEAGAGTGKTTLLVDRVVELVASRAARMDEVAAITFTEAAAADLRDKLAQKFENMATDDPDDPFRAAVGALDGAAVMTLHGFARKILSEQPFAVGLPPVFEVADASSSRVAFDERWDRFVNDLLEGSAHEELVVRALSCGMTWGQLREAALTCEENWDRLEAVDDAGPTPPADGGLVADLLQQAISLRAECHDDDDRLAIHLSTTTQGNLLAVGGATGPIDLLQILSGPMKLTIGNAGNRDNWTKSANGTPRKEEVLALLRQAEDERRRIVDQTVQWVLQSLFALIVAFTFQGTAERRRTGRLAFHDLLVLARELVHHPAARGELHQRYTHLLIDEFQDTDPIQAELALYLAAGPDAQAGVEAEWVDLPVPPGRLFFVGDPKQSIYRFRRADIDVFTKTRDRVVRKPLQLTTNFRSRPGIVDWVNTVFGAMFGEEQSGRQAGYVPLVAYRVGGIPAGELAPVIILGHEPVEGRAEDVREVQASEVAAAIATMHADEWKIGEPAQALRFSDVAVLVRTRTGLPILEDALRAAGVPYRLESSSLVYESQEVQDLLAILRAVDDPTDALSVVSALRSPGFGCGDDDLFAHHAAGGGWDPRSVPPHEGPVADAMVALRSYHEMRWWQGVSALVSQVVADRHLMSLALAQARPRETWRRIRFLQDQARLFDESNGGDLRAFLRWVGHQQEDGARVTEAILPESDDDAVRICTVHAAKGLEFPVTFVLGLQTGQNSQRPALLFGPRGPELCLKKTLETPGYDEALKFEREMELLEQQRLLYVAATRARDVLVVSVHRDRTAKPTLASQVVHHLESCTGLWSDGSDLGRLVPVPVREPTGATEQADDEVERVRFIERRRSLMDRATVPRTVAATAVSRLRYEELGGPDGAPDGVAAEEPLEHADAAAVQRRGRAGTAVGRAVHAVLQLIDLVTCDNLDALVLAQAVAEGVGERSREVRQLVRAAVESDPVRQAVASGRFWREVYVGVPVGARVLEGFIDLLFETPGGLAVVDYKTDRVGEDDVATITDRYRWQGASYALAVQRAVRKPVVSCTFLVLQPGAAIAAPLDDLDLAMAEVEQALRLPNR
jgi:ATP-dependent helicase/nuclease subunit A